MAAASVCALTAAGFLGAYWWGFDLASHFRQQYLAFLFLAALAAATRKRWRFGVAIVPFLIANLYVVAPYYLRLAQESGGSGPSRRFLLANVLIISREYERILKLVQESNPEVVVLKELSPEWKLALRSLDSNYPYTAANSEQDRFGIGVWSRFPIRSRILPATGAGRTSVEAVISFPEGPLALVATHPIPPMGPTATRWRNEQLSAIGRHIAGLDGPALLLSDLNATPWSHGFRELERLSGLRDTSRTSGLTPTWPSFLPGMRIPLDHCLVSPGVDVLDKRPGPFVGSDHLPVIVTLTL